MLTALRLPIILGGILALTRPSLDVRRFRFGATLPIYPFSLTLSWTHALGYSQRFLGSTSPAMSVVPVREPGRAHADTVC